MCSELSFIIYLDNTPIGFILLVKERNLKKEVTITNTYTKEEKNNNNNNNNIPQTSDNTNLYFYVILTLFGIMGFAITQIKNKNFNN